MRIFQVLESSTNNAIPGSQTWHRNLHEPLVDAGHEVVLFSAIEGRLAMERNDARGRGSFSQQLLDSFSRENRKKPFDLFFAYLKDGMVEPAAIDEIRKSGVPTCNFSCNNVHQFYLVDELAPHFDHSLHSEKDVAAKFRAIGANPFWWPMASNPKYFKPIDVPRTIQASFVGANYALRARYVAFLLESGIDVQAYGPGWQWGASNHMRSLAKRFKFLLRTVVALSPETQYRASANLADHDLRRSVGDRFANQVHPPVSDDDLISLYSRSHVSLGFLEVYDGHDASRVITRHLHLREFEAPMCRALYFTGYMEELAEMFEPDREVIVYRDQYELLDKVRYYLDHPGEADKIREAGYKRALQDHTYQGRFNALFQMVGLR
jgi:spore maturation protein CgeB